jgi:hypothetical protein
MNKPKVARSKPVPPDIRAIVGDADEDERAWIAERLAEIARRIRATVPRRRKTPRKRNPRLVVSRLR